MNLVGNIKNNFHFMPSPIINNFFDSAKSNVYNAPISKMQDCVSFTETPGSKVFQKKISTNET